jgi:hypothetical protein
MVRHKDPCVKCAARGADCYGWDKKACETCTGLKIGCVKASGGKAKASATTDEKKGKGKAPGKPQLARRAEA